jgi:hypothetical protein
MINLNGKNTLLILSLFLSLYPTLSHTITNYFSLSLSVFSYLSLSFSFIYFFLCYCYLSISISILYLSLSLSVSFPFYPLPVSLSRTILITNSLPPYQPYKVPQPPCFYFSYKRLNHFDHHNEK